MLLLPQPDDNAAVAVDDLRCGRCVSVGGVELTLASDVMVGHRVAVRRVERGDAVTSWGRAFGVALRVIEPGEYLCNQQMRDALIALKAPVAPPAIPNFQDRIEKAVLDETTFRPGRSPEPVVDEAGFAGYRRAGGRGTGTRNHVVVMALNSTANPYVQEVVESFGDQPGDDQWDGVVAVRHTEGGEMERPLNRDLLLRTLAGFLVHPNVGAALVVATPGTAVTVADFAGFLQEGGYPIEDLPHELVELRTGGDAEIEACRRIIRSWIPRIRQRRERVAADQLSLALQCGGSDAFSGISGNPLASVGARELVRRGGRANLAETDELINAEPYILENVRDAATARRFLDMVERYKAFLAAHGTSAEANPSAGNKYRGLYNIVTKSLGAAVKKHPDVRLDEVIEYGERMRQPGFHFMDSPGNDLESIAGQVASGCNLITFVTGNGSITNFPFVPTIKVVTTTARYRLLEEEMDVNAGRFLDGEDLEALGREFFEEMLRVSSGERTKGERAGHSQVSIWRNWRRATEVGPPGVTKTEFSGKPIPLSPGPATADTDVRRLIDSIRDRPPRTGLIVPTSLCSSQLAGRYAAMLNERIAGSLNPAASFVALPHTEGCGFAGGDHYALTVRILTGYLLHPDVAAGVVLEHGCDKVNLESVRAGLEARDVGPERFGWVSLQRDGGIGKAETRVREWWESVRWKEPSVSNPPPPVAVGFRSSLAPAAAVARELGSIAGALAREAAVLVAADDPLVTSPEFLAAAGVPAFGDADIGLAHAEAADQPGFYLVEPATRHRIESISGLGASGCRAIIDICGPEDPASTTSHPFVPVVPVVADGKTGGVTAEILAALSREPLSPRHVDFQITRGALAVSS